MTTGTSHTYAAAASIQIRGLQPNAIHLDVRQQPLLGKVALGKEKDRKPIDPPPVIQITIDSHVDPAQDYLQSPYYFMTCNLVGASQGKVPPTVGASLAGTLVSSLHRLKDTSNQDGAFFVFGDMAVKVPGKFRLQFNLYEMRHGDNISTYYKSIQSDEFTVLSPKQWAGMAESTILTKHFSMQGVRLRVRKEPRALLRKRGPAADDYEPQHYNRRPGKRGTQEGQIADIRTEIPLTLRIHEDYNAYNPRPPQNASSITERASQSQGDHQAPIQPNAFDPRSPMDHTVTAISEKASSQDQRDYQESMQSNTYDPLSPMGQTALQGSMQSNTYDAHPPIGRSYSYQSAESFSPAFSDAPSSKRPRTGSEQSQPQSFGHPESPIQSPHYPRMYEPQQGASYSQYSQLPQQQNHGYAFQQQQQQNFTRFGMPSMPPMSQTFHGQGSPPMQLHGRIYSQVQSLQHYNTGPMSSMPPLSAMPGGPPLEGQSTPRTSSGPIQTTTGPGNFGPFF